MSAEIIIPAIRPSWQDWIAQTFGAAPAITCAGGIDRRMIAERMDKGGPYIVTRCVFIVRGRAWCFVLGGDLDLTAAYNVGCAVEVRDPPVAIQRRLASMTGSQREASLINDAPFPWRYIGAGQKVAELARMN